MTYIEKLKDPRWQTLRLKVFERDRFTCQICFSKEKTLNVHHKVYQNGKDPWNYNINDLITLCDSCHEKYHISEKRYERLVKMAVYQVDLLGIIKHG